VIDHAGEEAPTNVYLSTTLIDEGLPADSKVATISGLDPDFGDTDTLSYSIIGANGGTFTIANGTDLMLEEVLDAASPPSPFNVTIRATDHTGRSGDFTFEFTVDEYGPKPFGSEFQINSYKDGPQENPSITALQDGGFVVTWQSATDWGAGLESFGQRYDSGGNKVGEEFLINYYGNDATRTDRSLPDSPPAVSWLPGTVKTRKEMVSRCTVKSTTPMVPRLPGNSGSIPIPTRPGFTVDHRACDTADLSLPGIQMVRMAIHSVFTVRFSAPTAPRWAENSRSMIHTDHFRTGRMWQRLQYDDNSWFVVTWETPGYDTDTSGSAVYARVFNSTGPMTGDILVNEFYAGDQGVLPSPGCPTETFLSPIIPSPTIIWTPRNSVSMDEF
jgi:hypothetical protein